MHEYSKFISEKIKENEKFESEKADLSKAISQLSEKQQKNTEQIFCLAKECYKIDNLRIMHDDCVSFDIEDSRKSKLVEIIKNLENGRSYADGDIEFLNSLEAWLKAQKDFINSLPHPKQDKTYVIQKIKNIVLNGLKNDN